jgi:CRP-like cAMP-binding protein
VQALTRCLVAVVSKELLLQVMSDRPAVRQAIWLDSLLDASVFREWVVNVGRRDARQRIAHLLCELALRLKAAGLGEGPLFDFPLTQEQIADATGLTAVHTNRTLQALRRAGLINLTASKLTILDWDALAEAGDFSERYLHHSV